jgi:aconitase A
VARLPVSLKVLLEYLLRSEDGQSVSGEDIEALAGWDPAGPASIEIAFTPSRVLMQDFTERAGDRRPGGDARRDGRTIEAMKMTQPDL